MPIKRESWLCEKWFVWIELFLSFLGLSNGLINNKKIEFEIIKEEKIYENIKAIFIYFQSNGCSIQISNGCKP